MNDLELALLLDKPRHEIRKALSVLRHDRDYGTKRYPVLGETVLEWEDGKGDVHSQLLTYGIPYGTAHAVMDYLKTRPNFMGHADYSGDAYDVNSDWSGLGPKRAPWGMVKVNKDRLVIKNKEETKKLLGLT